MRTSLFFLLLFGSVCLAQTIHSFRLDIAAETSPGLAGNGITDIRAGNNTLWLGTGHGLSRTRDGGQSFDSFTTESGIGKGSISGLWVSGDTIWVATASDSFLTTFSETSDIGTGLSLSEDGGQSWTHYPQPGPTPVKNLTYDIAVFRNTIWIVSWGGGIRKSSDWGETWEAVAPDTFVFNVDKHLNHRGFSAVATDDAIWIGTAGGINKSKDNGETWISFTHNNQQNPISGNFVVALDYQRTETKNILWAATWKAEDEDEYYAVSCSRDGGQNWQTMLEGEKAHNFAFDDSVVYVATDNGLFKSIDSGQNWYVLPDMIDKESGERLYTTEIYSAYAQNGDLWVGSADGLARTSTNGYSWTISRAFRHTGEAGEVRTYAYPNPFSPFRHNQLGGDGHVRIQYDAKGFTTVTIKIYDFAMDLVTTLVDQQTVLSAGDYTAVWSGKNDYGDMVSNGVYFYRVELDGDGVYWGKIIVMN